MKIKIIKAEYHHELEAKVNKVLDRLDNNDIIDIKYQGVGNSPAYSTDRLSAMLILTNNGYKKIEYCC